MSRASEGYIIRAQTPASLTKSDITVVLGFVADSSSLIKCTWLTSVSEDRTSSSPSDSTAVDELVSRVGQG